MRRQKVSSCGAEIIFSSGGSPAFLKIPRTIADDAVFGEVAATWHGRSNPGVEYVGYSSDSGGSVTVDLAGLSGTWELFESDADNSGATEVSAGQKVGGSSQVWTLANLGEVAVRVVQVQAPGQPPPPPTQLEVN